jgi:hypothetical protein
VDDFAVAVNAQTRLLAVSAVQSATGAPANLAALAEIVHHSGGWLFVDACQAGGAVPLDVIRRLGLPQPAIVEAYRRLIFSLATVNYDDHLKNFAFLMDHGGAWRLSPAYDVSYAENDGWTSQHQMSVAGKFRGITRQDCLRVARAFDMREHQAAEIVDEVLEAVGLWGDEARAVDLDPDFRAKMFDRLARERALLVE